MSSYFTTTFDSKLFARDHDENFRSRYYPEHLHIFKSHIIPILKKIKNDPRCALHHAKAGDLIIIIPSLESDTQALMRRLDDYTATILEVYASPYPNYEELRCPSPKQHVSSSSYKLTDLNEVVVFYLHPDYHHIFEYTNDKPKRGSVLPRFSPLIPDAL